MNTTLKWIALVLLFGAAAVGWSHWSRAGFPSGPIWAAAIVGFGALNVFARPPKTGWMRAIAVFMSIAVLARPDALMGLFVLVVLFWPPVFGIAWLVARQPADEAAAARSRLTLAIVIGAVAAASMAYRLVLGSGLQQTAALFIGVPAILSIVVVLCVTPRTAIGVACKAVTVGLLVSLLFLWEGMLCVLMSAPLFYAVAIAIASLFNRGRAGDGTVTVRSWLVVLAIVPMSLEGVTGATTVNRNESVEATRIVPASAKAVERALFEPPRFERILPHFLRAGFPTPVSARIDGAGNGLRWIIAMRGGEMKVSGMEARTGDLVLALEEHRPGCLRWRAVSDTSHMTHFLNWQEIVVRWEPAGPGATRVTWTLRYRRGLDPAWYFGPMERYAARLAAGYLIEAVAVP